MKKMLSVSNFRDEFYKCGRKDQFSYDGLGAIYEYLEENWEDYELDVVGICCEYAEYENFEELQKDRDVEDMDELQNNTSVIMIDEERFIIAQY